MFSGVALDIVAVKVLNFAGTEIENCEFQKK